MAQTEPSQSGASECIGRYVISWFLFSAFPIAGHAGRLCSTGFRRERNKKIPLQHNYGVILVHPWIVGLEYSPPRQGL